MPRQSKNSARLAPGTTIVDYSSPGRIRAAFGSEKAIREEYSRLRSITRKRVERLEKAGETHNWLYRTFGDLKTALPSSRGLSTGEMMTRMAAAARAVGGGYQSTLREIKEARREQASALAVEAEESGDTELAELLRKNPTSAQWDRINRVMGMIRKTVGKSISSDDVQMAAIKEVLSSKSKRSLLSIAASVINDLDMGDENSLEALKAQFTTKGTTRISWKQSHGKKG